MKMRFKRGMLLLLTAIFVMGLMACNEKDTIEEKTDKENTSTKSTEDVKKNKEEDCEGVRTVALGILSKIAQFNEEDMKEYMVPDLIKDDELIEESIFESYEDGIYTYDAYGVRYKATLNMDFTEDDLLESSVEELEIVMNNTASAKSIKWNKIEDVYIYIAESTGEMNILEMEIDYEEASIDSAGFEAEFGKTYEEYMREELVKVYEEPLTWTVYVVKYDGEWKVAYIE